MKNLPKEKLRSRSIILTLILGPLGLLYADWKIALGILVVCFGVGAVIPEDFSATYLLIIQLVVHFGSVLVGDFLIKEHNQKVVDQRIRSMKESSKEVLV